MSLHIIPPVVDLTTNITGTFLVTMSAFLVSRDVLLPPKSSTAYGARKLKAVNIIEGPIYLVRNLVILNSH